ncbi:hypothetical protein Slin14017_G118060 [Septoria linicola]|nr:hypothetical protein Slin14017_G118060 [Septoria linicola]
MSRIIRTSNPVNPWRDWRTQRKAPETPKTVVSGSLKRAVLRNLVHILPITVLSSLIWLNWGHYYIGPSFIIDPEKNSIFMGGIQFCAKLEELLCVASLAAIILHALRHELLGDGVPIGLLSSGIWFSSVSAFWSPDFRGAISWSNSSWRRARSCIHLVVCGLLALTIGPASAFFMLPRDQSVPIEETESYLPGTSDDFWPSRVVASTELDVCRYPNATEYAFCPSGGYPSLARTLSSSGLYTAFCQAWGEGYSPACQARGAEGNRQWNNFLIQSPRGKIPAMMNGIRHTTWASNGHSAVQPHAATIMMMDILRREAIASTSAYNTPGTRQFRWTYDLHTRGASTNPWVRTKCTRAQNLTATADTAEFMPMVRQNATRFAPAKVDKATDFAFIGKPRSSIAASPRTYELNGWPFPLKSLLIEWPWLNGSRIGVGCTVAAAWHNSTIRSQRSSSYSAFSVALSGDDFLQHDDSPDYDVTNSPVALDQIWLELLTPTVPADPFTNVSHVLSTYERILDNLYISGIPNDMRERYAATICLGDTFASNVTDTERGNNPSCNFLGWELIQHSLAMIVVDGLSRYGSHKASVNEGDFPRLEAAGTGDIQPDSSHDPTTRRLQAARRQLGNILDRRRSRWVLLLGYYASTKTDKFALAGLCVYIFVALSHMNSPNGPSHKLDNGSGGVSQKSTHKAVVKVRAFPPPDGLGQPRLRLVLDDDTVSVGSGSVTDGGSSTSSLKKRLGDHQVTDVELGAITPVSLVTPTSILSPADSRVPLNNNRQSDGARVLLDHKYS